MKEVVYSAPWKIGLSLDDMLARLAKVHRKEFSGAVVVYGNGLWSGQAWECATRDNPSGKKLGNLAGMASADATAMREAIGRVGLVIFDERYRGLVYTAIPNIGYSLVGLAYEGIAP